MAAITNTSYLTPHLIHLNDYRRKTQIEKLIRRVLASQQAKELARKAYEEGDPLYGERGAIQVQYDPSMCLALIGTANIGFTDHTNRQIILGTLDKIKALDILIFEIANSSQTRQYRIVEEQIQNGSLDCEGYVKKLEEIKYTSIIFHHQIVQDAIQNLGWPEELDTFKDISRIKFEKLWHEKIRFSTHAQMYRKQYAMITNKKETTLGYREKLDSKMRILFYRIKDILEKDQPSSFHRLKMVWRIFNQRPLVSAKTIILVKTFLFFSLILVSYQLINTHKFHKLTLARDFDQLIFHDEF